LCLFRRDWRFMPSYRRYSFIALAEVIMILYCIIFLIGIKVGMEISSLLLQDDLKDNPKDKSDKL